MKVRKIDLVTDTILLELDAPRFVDATSIVPFAGWTAALGAAAMANVPTLSAWALVALTIAAAAIALRRIV